MSAGSSSLSRAAQRVRRQVRADVEVGDLRERVDAGVGAARPVELEVVAAGDRSDGAVDLALDRPGVLLNLPAAVARAGVLDGQLEAGHGTILGATGCGPGVARPIAVQVQG